MNKLDILFSGKGLHALSNYNTKTDKYHTFTNPINLTTPINKQDELSGELIYTENIPESFDWREEAEKKGIKLESVKNQKTCGNCWSMSSSSVLSDRFNIKNKNYSTPDFSPLNLMSCSIHNNKHGGCLGGNIKDAGHILETHGISSNECSNWSKWCGNNCSVDKTDNDNIRGCCYYSNCNVWFSKPGSTSTIHGKYVKPRYTKLQTFNDKLHKNIKIVFNQDPKYSQNQIKKEIMNNGPVVSSYFVFDDFQKYMPWKTTNNIYIHGSYSNQTNLDGGHAVEIIGWGNHEKEGEYWIVKNSWGDKWNDDGYFNIAMTTYKDVSSYNNILEQTVNGFTGIDTPFIISGDNSSSLFGGVTFFEPDLSRQNIKGKCDKTFLERYKIIILIIFVLIIMIIIFLFK